MEEAVAVNTAAVPAVYKMPIDKDRLIPQLPDEDKLEQVKFMKRLIMGCFIIMIMGFLIRVSPFYYPLRSFVVMYPYSYYHQQMSLIQQTDFNLQMPGGFGKHHKPWHPLMLVFHDEYGFAHWQDEPWGLTVLYRFGGFEFGLPHSSYYDPDADAYSSFYGAYLVKHQTEASQYYGFDDAGKMIPGDWSRITEYDQRYLVMPSLGLPPEQVVFNIEITEIQENIDYLEWAGWTRVDARIETNSPQHRYRGHQRGYLQYGLPLEPFENEPDFELITLYGRIYARQFDPWDVSVALYVVASSQEWLEVTDKQFISITRLPPPH